MTSDTLLEELKSNRLLTSEQILSIEHYERQKPVSLYIYVKTLLYLSITAVIGGLGVLVYENINTAGHIVLISTLSLITIGCLLFVFRKGLPYSPSQVIHPTAYLDTILLLGCLLFLVVEGYAQYQFEVFGTRYGLGTLIPAVFFLILAYRFDHQGVLSLGLSSLASWVGLTVTPNQIMVQNDFTDQSVIITALVFGSSVLVLAKALEVRGIKPHFNTTYLLVAGTLYLLAATAGLITHEGWKIVYTLLVAAGCWYFYVNARRGESLLFLLISLIFGYITLTYLIFNNLSLEIGAFLGSLYFLVSAAGVVWFLLNYKKIVGHR